MSLVSDVVGSRVVHRGCKVFGRFRLYFFLYKLSGTYLPMNVASASDIVFRICWSLPILEGLQNPSQC